MPDNGSQCRVRAKTICRMMATQKTGAEMPNMARLMRVWSTHVPRLAAATTPTTTPSTRANT